MPGHVIFFEVSAGDYVALKVQEWQRRLLHCVAGLLVFETVSGLAIWLLPFTVPSQLIVLLHTVAGLVFVIPFAWYQLRHWRIYRALRVSHVKLTGYFSMAASVALVVSGLILTYQAAWSTKISYAWDVVHIVGTFALVASVLPHVLTLMTRGFRARADGDARVATATRRFTTRTVYIALAPFALLIPLLFAYRAPVMSNKLPADYSYVFGPDQPFRPSLARTSSGGAYDARLLAGSESCGTSNCHKQIVDEWSVSAHRYAAMDAAFQKVQSVMGEQNGPESTRYCGGCHDPISLFSGMKNMFVKDLTGHSGYQEGVSCMACHAIKKTDIKGNAAYVIDPPKRYMFELAADTGTRPIRDFLIRAYPRYHVASLQRKLFKSPEFCAACHKQFIDQEINKVGWVQLQNQYDNWRKSRWNHPGDPTRTIECRECHMALTASDDPASGDDRDYNRSPDDGKHRSHRFIAANQFIPAAMHLTGGAEQIRLTEKWLRGETAIPEIANKWRTGVAVPLEVIAPAMAKPGEPVNLQVVITNNKVGHDFPTGPLDIIQAWVEVVVTDQAGRVVFKSGQRDTANFIAPGSFMFKSEPVDQYGNLIDRHNLWEMVGVRYRRSVFPGFSDRADFTFDCPGTFLPTPDKRPAPTSAAAPNPLNRTVAMRVPGGPVSELHVSAKLLYRKADQFLINFLFGAKSGLTAPVTVMSEDQKTIRVTMQP